MNSAPPLADQDRRVSPRFRLTTLFLIAVVTWCALPLSPSQPDSDFWGHVQYGLDVWNDGLDRTSTYTYNSFGYRWINHENLAELTFAAFTRFGNGRYLLMLKCLMGVSLLGLAVAQGRRIGVDNSPLGVSALATCLIVASINLSFYWGVRPHLFSFFFFGLMIALFAWVFNGWADHWHGPRLKSNRAGCATRQETEQAYRDVARRIGWLWLIPLLLVVWTNTHGGFLAGLAVALAMLSLRALEFMWEGGKRSLPIALHLILIAIVTSLVTLLNPYGIGLHAWLIESLGVPRPEILEWHPPAWFTSGAGKLWAMVVVVTLGLVGSTRPRDLTRTVVLLLVASQAIKHQRHVPFVAILMLFWLPAHLASFGNRFRSLRSTATPSTPLPSGILRLAGGLLLVVTALLAVRVGSRLTVIPVERNVYPVSAVQFIADQSLTGRLVTTGQWAQYVLGVVGAKEPDDAGVQVAFDGRFRTCYPQEIVDLHFDFFLGPGGPDKRYRSAKSPSIDRYRLLSHNAPNLVLINRQQPQQVKAMQAVQQEWSLLYQDGLAQLWGRRSVYDDSSLATYVPKLQRIVDGGVQRGFVPFPAAPNPLPKTRVVVKKSPTTDQDT